MLPVEVRKRTCHFIPFHAYALASSSHSFLRRTPSRDEPDSLLRALHTLWIADSVAAWWVRLTEVADGIHAEMGHHAPAPQYPPARTARPGGRAARPRLHRRVVERGQRPRRVHPARRGGAVDHRAAVRHRDRRDLH